MLLVVEMSVFYNVSLVLDGVIEWIEGEMSSCEDYSSLSSNSNIEDDGG